MRRVETTNHGPRRGRGRVRLIVLHYTAMTGGADRVVDLFRDPARELSAHYVVGPDGTVVAMVPEDRRAWHAGAGRWGPIVDVNSASVGIELCNDGASPFAAAQMDAVVALMRGIRDRHGVPPEGVVGHSDCAPGRKIDPGRRFDWRRLAREELAVWPGAGTAPPCPARFRRDAGAFGYTADVALDVLLSAVRLRFRPGAAGPLDARDMGIAADLAARWPFLAEPVDAAPGGD